MGASHAAAVVRDGVGWARLLAGGTLRLRAGRATGRAGMALLESDGVPGGGGAAAGGGSAVPATLAVGMLAGQGQGGLLRVAVLGEVRSEVTVDERAGLTRVETWTGDGGRIAPSRYESSARLALRRALEAARTGRLLPDLGELRDDDALAAALLLPRGV